MINNDIFLLIFFYKTIKNSMYEKPSQESIYQSTYQRQVINDAQQRAEDKFRLSKDPLKTGIISKDANGTKFSSIDNISTLTGQQMTSKDYTHNNMAPFLRGNVTQNTESFANNSRLAKHTGIDDTFIHKRETECFYKPVSNVSNVCGMKNNDDFYRSRISNPISHKNSFPIKQIQVGPGLNAGYSSVGSGGFQQNSTRCYAMPTDLQSVKPKTDQTSRTFQTPIQGPQKSIDKRANITPIDKNRPDTTFEKSLDDLLPSMASVLKETSRDTIQNIKATNASLTHVEYQGPVKKVNEYGTGLKDDYGKNTVMVYDNERQITETRTNVSNATSLVKSIVSPITDVFKDTVKTYLLDAPRPHGNLQVSAPEKQTTYDPISHMFKTTIKETLVHDTTMNNIKGATAGIVESDDQARKTIKETTPVYDTQRNINSQTYKVTVYDVDAAKTIIKKTNKETTIKGKSEYGWFGGLVNSIFGGYEVFDARLEDTQKQYVSDYAYSGIAESSNKEHMSQEASYNMTHDQDRENLLNTNHTPNAGGKYVSTTKEMVKMKSNRLVEESIAREDMKSIEKVYQTRGTIGDITKENTQYNGYKDRLDPNMVKSLNNNPFNLKINH